MILTNYDKEGKLQGFAVLCSCGCDSILFRTMDDTVFISLYGSNWYEHQGLGTIRNSFELIKKKVKQEKLYLCGVIMTLDETKEFFDLSYKLCFGEDTDDIFVNDSCLRLEYIDVLEDNPNADVCELQICLMSNMIDLLRNKGYKGTEICLKKNEWFHLIEIFEKYFESHVRSKRKIVNIQESLN